MCVFVRHPPTLCCQRWHVLVRPPVDLVSVCVHSQHQHHDASHNAPGDWTHRGALDHVQGSHLLICGGQWEEEKGRRGWAEGRLKYRGFQTPQEATTRQHETARAQIPTLMLRCWDIFYFTSILSSVWKEKLFNCRQTASSPLKNW